jgi:hypothetical protein
VARKETLQRDPCQLAWQVKAAGVDYIDILKAVTVQQT